MNAPESPTILEQIDAVEWAETYAAQLAKLARIGETRPATQAGLNSKQIYEILRRLEAAAETLRTLEFGSAIAR